MNSYRHNHTSNIFIVYDCPWNSCDKKWLFENIKQLNHNGETFCISPKLHFSRLSKANFFSKIRLIYEIFKQVFFTLFKSKGNDVIICWYEKTGLIMNLFSILLGNRRKIIAMNWLSPYKGNVFLHKLLASNTNAKIVLNSPESEQQWKFVLKSNKGAFYFIPDTYNSDLSFQPPKFPVKKYFFTGGMANRNWNLILNLAVINPHINFICVALKNDWDKKVQSSIPENVQVFFNLSTKDYYDLMRRSFAVLLPLCNDNVSGLINITMSAQLGVPCIINETPSTRLYYSGETKQFLIDDSIKNWNKIIKMILSLSDNDYKKNVISFQEFIKNKFNPILIAQQIFNLWG